MREFTLEEFEMNLARARSLVGVYELTRGTAGGRRSVSKTDVLRAATVFLHSSLEEVIRNLFLWKLPDGNSAVLDTIPLVGGTPTHRAAPFLLGRLVPHRGRFVENVIRDSLKSYVDHMNVNNVAELRRCLEMVGVQPDAFAQYYPRLGRMMDRRHQIVHQMDRNPEDGVGHHAAQSISVAQVNEWADNLAGFVQNVVAAVPD